MKATHAETPVDLEEAADEYEKGYYDDCSAAKKAAYHGFIAGAKWQAEQDTRDMFMSDNRHFEKVYELGKKDMREQMMKDWKELWSQIVSKHNPLKED